MVAVEMRRPLPLVLQADQFSFHAYLPQSALFLDTEHYFPDRPIGVCA